MCLRDILFNYQNKYLQAGVAASLFRQGEKLSPSWALIASRHQDRELILRDPLPSPRDIQPCLPRSHHLHDFWHDSLARSSQVFLPCPTLLRYC